MQCFSKLKAFVEPGEILDGSRRETRILSIFHQKYTNTKNTHNWITIITNQEGILINYEDDIWQVFIYLFKYMFTFSTFIILREITFGVHNNQS